MLRTTSRFIGVLFVLSLIAVWAGPAHAGNVTWVGNTDATWATAGNWTGGVPTGNTPVFGAAGSSGTTLLNDLAVDASINGMTFSNSADAFTIGGSSITLNGNITVGTGITTETIDLPMILNGNRTATVNSGVLTLGGDISQSGTGRQLIKAGAGTLVLSGTNTYSGTTTVSAGTLLAKNAAALPNYATQAITVTTSGTLLAVNAGLATPTEWSDTEIGNLLSNAAVTFASGTSFGIDTTGGGFTYGNVIPNKSNMGLTKLGANTLVLSAANLYPGATMVGSSNGADAGTLQLSGAGKISNAATTVYGGALDLNGTTQTVSALSLGKGASGSTATVSIGAGDLRLGGNVTYDATNNPNGATISGAGGGFLSLLGNRTFTVGDSSAAAADLTISAIIQNGDGTARQLIKAGAGTMVLSGANTYTGGTNIQVGTLRSGANDVLPDTGQITIGSGNNNATLDLYGYSDTVANIFFGAFDVSKTCLISTGVGTLTLGGNITQDSNAYGTKTISGNLSLGSATRTIANSGNTKLYISAVISNGALSNSSNLNLSGANIYAGGTTLTGGTTEMAVDPVGTVPSITSSAIGTGTLTLNGGTISSDGATAREILNAVTFSGNGGVGNATNSGKVTFSAGVNLGGAARQVNVAANSTAQFDGIVSNGGIVNSGPGTLIITNTSNSFTGGGLNTGNNNPSGIFRWGASNVFPDTATLSTGGNGTDDLAGFDDTVASIFLGVSQAGQLSSITTGAGTLTINGNITTDSNAWGNQLISGKLNLGGATRTISLGTSSNLPKTLTISADISAGAGAGISFNGTNTTLALSGTNTYDGGTSAAAATTLIFSNTAAKPGTGITTVAAGATLGLGVGATPTYFDSTDVDNLFANTLALVSMNATAGVAIDTSAGDFTYATDQTSARKFTKLGLNKLTLSGDNSLTGGIILSQGTLELTGDNSGSTNLTTATGTLLQVTTASSFPTGTITLGDTLEYSGASTSVVGNFALAGSATFNITEAGTTLSLPGATGAASSGSLVKAGPGTLSISGAPLFTGATTVNAGSLVFNSRQSYTGTTTINNGSLVLAGGDHTLVVNKTLTMSGGTLDLGANDQYVGGLSGTGGIITGSGRFATNVTTSTFAGSFQGSLNVARVGNNTNTLTLTADSTTTGSFSVIGGDNPQTQGPVFGGVTLKDGGRLSGITALNVSNASLFIDNSGTANDNTRVNDLATVTLDGGRIMYTGRASTASTESFGAVTLNSGHSTISATAGSSGSAELTLDTLTRNSGATLRVDGTNLGTAGNNGRIIVTGGMTGNLALVNGVVPGVVAGGLGVNNVPIVTYDGTTGLKILTTYSTATSLTAVTALENVDWGKTTTRVVKSGGQTVNSISGYTGGGGAITFDPVTGASDTLVLGAGMITSNANSTLTIGTTTLRGNLTSGLSTGELFLIKTNEGGGGGASGNIHSVITDNGGIRVKLVLDNYNRTNLTNQLFNLTANNTYTGGTVVSGGNEVYLTASTVGWTPIAPANDPTQGLVINNSIVTEVTNAQQIAAANIVTLNGGSVLNLVGANNTLAGIVFNSNGGRSQIPTVTGGTQMTITGDISSTPANVAVTPVISVKLDLNGSALHDITVSALPEGNLVNNGATPLALNGLTISSVIQNGGFTKKGDGVLNLTGANIFDKQLTVEEGVLNVASVNNVSTNGVLGNSALSVTLGGAGGKTGTLEYTGGTASSSKPFTMATGGTGAFQVDVAATNLTISGLIDGSGGLAKTGLGTLTLTNASNAYTGDTVVQQGILSINTAFLNDASTVDIYAGAKMNLTFSGSDTIAELWLGGVQMAAGFEYNSVSNPLYFTGSGKLKVVSLVVLGDADGNGVVDAADYILIKTNFDTGGYTSYTNGDVSGDGNVDWTDLQILMTALSTSGTSASNTPEPATLGLLAIGALAMLKRKRKA